MSAAITRLRSAHVTSQHTNRGGGNAEPPFVFQLCVNCDATRLAAGLSDGRVRLYDTSTLGLVGELLVAAGSRGRLRAMAWAGNDPVRLWSCTSDGGISCWNWATGKAERSLPPPPPPTSREKDLEGVLSGPFALASSPAGDVLAVGVAHEIHLWDLRRPGEAAVLGVFRDAHSHYAPSFGTVRHLLFHPAVPHTLLSAGDDGVVNVFDLSIAGEDDALVSVLCVGSAVADMGLFGPHGALLWVVTEVGGLSLWNIASAQRLADFSSLRMQVLEAGLPIQYFVSCFVSGGAGEDTLTLIGGAHDGSLTSFAVGPTSVTPAAAAWQPPSPAAVGGGHSSTVRSACYLHVWPSPAAAAPAGLVLFTGGEDGCVCQWADPPAGEAMRPSAVGAAGGARSWRLALPTLLSQRNEAALSAAGAVAHPLTAAVFGTRSPDPISDAEEDALPSRELTALLADGEDEPMADDGGAAAANGPRLVARATAGKSKTKQRVRT